MNGATKAAGRQRQIVEMFDERTRVSAQSSSHTHTEALKEMSK